MAEAPNGERRLNLFPRADYLDDSEGLEDYSLGDDESIVSNRTDSSDKENKIN